MDDRGRHCGSRQDEEDWILNQWQIFSFSFIRTLISLIRGIVRGITCLKLILSQVKTNWLSGSKESDFATVSQGRGVWALAKQVL